MGREPSGPVLDQLFRDHEHKVREFVRHRAAESALVDDIVGDTFMAAAVALASDPTVELTIGWFYTVARRRLHDHWRRERGRARPRAALHRHGMNHDVEAFLASLAVLDALIQLPERQRVALHIRYLLGGSVTDVATQVGCSYQGAESLLARGRHSFAALYEVV